MLAHPRHRGDGKRAARDVSQITFPVTLTVVAMTNAKQTAGGFEARYGPPKLLESATKYAVLNARRGSRVLLDENFQGGRSHGRSCRIYNWPENTPSFSESRGQEGVERTEGAMLF